MIKLFIDTRDSHRVLAKLDIDGQTYESYSTEDTKRPESILILIDDVCNKAGVKIDSIDELNIEEGPGSYTGLKVGVSVANALSFSIEKKVNGRPLGELVEPKYQ